MLKRVSLLLLLLDWPIHWGLSNWSLVESWISLWHLLSLRSSLDDVGIVESIWGNNRWNVLVDWLLDGLDWNNLDSGLLLLSLSDFISLRDLIKHVLPIFLIKFVNLIVVQFVSFLEANESALETLEEVGVEGKQADNDSELNSNHADS